MTLLRLADCRWLAVAAIAAASVPVQAQERRASAVLIAVPPLATAKNVDTEAGKTWVIGNQIAELIAADLKSAGDLIVADTKAAPSSVSRNAIPTSRLAADSS